MKYNNLQELIANSSSSRQYFVSLPVLTQLMLHEQAKYIHTAAELHARADDAERYRQAAANSDFYGGNRTN